MQHVHKTNRASRARNLFPFSISNRVATVLLLLLTPLYLHNLSAEEQQTEEGETTEKIPEIQEPGNDESKIVSDTVDIDFNKHVAMFKGNVKAYDKNQTLTSDRMKVRFTKNNQLKMIIAVGNVVIDQPAKNRHAEAGRAKYNVASGKITLTENPSLKMGDSRIQNAAVIVYYPDTKQITSMSGDGKRPELKLNPEGEGGLFQSNNENEEEN